MSRKEKLKSIKDKIWSKEIVQKNEVFEEEQIADFWEMYTLFADNQYEISMKDIMFTTHTLGYDKQFPLVYEAIARIAHQNEGHFISFETFLTQLTHTVGHNQTQEGRSEVFSLLDREGKDKLTYYDLKQISQDMKYNLTDDQLHDIVRAVAGPNKKQITWEQFDQFILNKKDKKFMPVIMP